MVEAALSLMHSLLQTRAFSCGMRYCCDVPRVERHTHTNTYTKLWRKKKKLYVHTRHSSSNFPSTVFMNVNEGGMHRDSHSVNRAEACDIVGLQAIGNQN